jgi:RNA exonuclease 1
MGISHTRILDTGLLYTHPRGHPFKPSLKHLTKKYLKKEIQAGEHNSVEDAICALQLAKLKVRKLAAVANIVSARKRKKLWN